LREVPTTGAATLAQTVAAEAEAVQQFVDLLKLEQAALGSGNTDDLPEFAEKKSKLAVHLGGLAAQRNATLSAQGFAADRVGVEAWCAKHGHEKKIVEAWTRILSLAAEARELNRLNGELIRIRMQYNTQALEALIGGKTSLDLYGPDGQSTMPSNRHINDAV
jgi:flagella synthesis protein FlgN